MAEKTNCHDGHRQRLRTLVDNNGLNNISNIQAVEYFLTYIFPRGDVNPLAHKLLDRYGTFANIIEANVNDLMRIKGLNKTSAQKIRHFGLLFEYYTQTKNLQKRISLKNTKEFLKYLESIAEFKKTENLFMFAIDQGFKLIDFRVSNLNNVRAVGIEPLELYDFISSTKLAYLIIAHNHPGGSAFPSQDDIGAVNFIEKLIKFLPCKLIDSFIVGTDGIYSQKQETFLNQKQEEENFDFLN